MPQYGYSAPRMNFDSTLTIPTTNGVPTLKSNITRKGALAIDSTNGRFYFYNPKTLVWDTIRGGGSTSATRLITNVYNSTGSTIPKGSVVYISGRHSSNLPTIALAQGNNEENSYKTFALVENDIETSNQGVVIQAGKIENLNLPTSSYTDGDVVYLSPTTPGGITTTKPLAPYHICKIGSITRAHPTFGSIEIKIENGWQLDELSDVQIAAVPADSTILQFSRVDSLWHDVSINNAIGTKYLSHHMAKGCLIPALICVLLCCIPVYFTHADDGYCVRTTAASFVGVKERGGNNKGAFQKRALINKYMSAQTEADRIAVPYK